MVLGCFYITSANAVNKITKGGILPVLCQFGIKERIMFKCINRNENRNIGNNLVMNMMVLHIREKELLRKTWIKIFGSIAACTRL